jgi:FkbM family methyltransferase
MIKLQQNKVFVQIGTNDGDDEFNKFVRSYHPSQLILVEPNSDLNDKIKESYKGISCTIINAAVMDKTRGLVKLVHPKNRFNGNGKCVSNGHYIDKHFSLLPMDDWGDDFVEIQAPSITFTDICKMNNIKDIHYLQIDTEGYDAEIIKSIDFKKVNIDIIKYEDWSFSEDSFQRHGNKGKDYGVSGMRFVAHMLLNLGYTITKESTDILAVKNYKIL